MTDVLPPAVSKWQYVEEKARAVLECFAYRELRTPGPIERAYVAHARWEREPVTRWYRLPRAGEVARLEAAAFGIPGPSGDAELIGTAVGLLSEVGLPASTLSLSLRAADEVCRLVATLGITIDRQSPPAFHDPEAMVFEIHCAHHRVATGARRDPLVSSLAGPPVPALLLEIEIEPVVAALEDPPESFEPPLIAFFLSDGPVALAWALEAAHRLRLDGVRAELDHASLSVDAQRARATAVNARLRIEARESDLAGGRVLVEDTATGRHEVVAVGDLMGLIRQRVD